MLHDRKEMFAAIWGDRNDQTKRLVLADWLEENRRYDTDPRVEELFRVCVEIERLVIITNEREAYRYQHLGLVYKVVVDQDCHWEESLKAFALFKRLGELCYIIFHCGYVWDDEQPICLFYDVFGLVSDWCRQFVDRYPSYPPTHYNCRCATGQIR